MQDVEYDAVPVLTERIAQSIALSGHCKPDRWSSVLSESSSDGEELTLK
jgi:hypothetical protein